MAVRRPADDARSQVPADDGDELVIRTTPGGRYTYVSPAVRQILGYEPEELLTQAPFETVHPDDLMLVGSAGDRLAAGSEQESVLLRKRHADGHDVWLDARIATVRDPTTDEVVEILATARDVTAQVVTERALEQRVGAESLIGDVSRELLTATADEIDAVVVRSLERAARFVGAERATLVLLSDDGEAAVRTHEWAVDPAFESVESMVSVATVPWLLLECRRGDVVFARSLDDLPAAARVERDILEAKGVRSVACVPITSGDALTGGLSFNWRTRDADDCSAALSTLGVLADVPVVALDRKDAEQALASSEARFRSLVQGTSDLILVTDADGVVHYASPSIQQFAYSEGDVLGRSAFEFVHPDDVDRTTARFVATMTSDNRNEPVEFRLLDGTGAWRRVEALGTDHLADPVVQGVVINVRDIAERKDAEAALRESEERFRALVQHATDMITVLDAEGMVVYTSPSAASILGWHDGEYVGRSAFALLHPDDRERVRGVFGDAVTRRGSTEPVQSRMRHTNGEYRLLESIATNLLDDPAVRGLVINSRDITERRQLENELLQSQKMEAVGRLAGGIAHDFNNLLTAIAGYTALLLDEHPDDESLRADLSEIEQAATRGAALVDQLLSFSRRKMLMPTVLDLNEVVESTRGLLSRVIGADVELVTRLARALDGVRADRTQIEQVLLNLVVNARDAMPDGGRLEIETANVTLRPRDVAGQMNATVGPHVLLSVRDTGTGMDRVTQAQVFEPFFTTKEVGQGTGLGLSTAYGIVTQAGGHISVDSRLGSGTMFRVYLPIESRDPRAAAPAQDDTTPRSGRETILLVEDESTVRSLARDVLTRLGYEVLVAADGREALEVADRCRERINLLVSDVVLPHLRGVEVADRLRARRPGLRVLYISGYTETAIVHDGQLDPGVDFLAKPFRPADLAHRVREVLDA
ncbi:MAG TPA: PAS domain S-box protein [Acidimicrobiia bacterium]|nr:PAS domain S-box protein [Acidimicrobiia bacterium]